MSNAAQLLRMLEPAVRPVAVPAAGAAPAGAVPFESASFEALLGEAMPAPVDEGKAGGPGAGAADAADPLDSLARFDAVESASLRHLLNVPGRRAAGGEGTT